MKIILFTLIVLSSTSIHKNENANEIKESYPPHEAILPKEIEYTSKKKIVSNIGYIPKLPNKIKQNSKLKNPIRGLEWGYK